MFYLMAAFDLVSYLKSDAFSLRHPNGSPFGIPSFFIGFNPNNSSDNDSGSSPTSPLNIVFSSFKNPFGFRSQKSSSHAGGRRILDCSKVGLGIINSLAEETRAIREVNGAKLERKSIIFRPQVKKTGVPDCSRHCCESLESVMESNKSVIVSLPKLIGRDSLVESSLVSKPSSLPVSIGSGHSQVNTLSATDIELSEDYTCVICRGPNPKTTHIFCDCILECQSNESSNFAKTEEQEIMVLPQDEVTPFPSDKLLSFCSSCKNELKEGEDIYIYRGEKAFCSLECRSKAIFAEEKTERSLNNSSRGSPKSSSSHEDLFLTGSDQWA